jgi:glutathione S-transferase
MNEIEVLSIPGSPFARAVLVALEEKGAPYRMVALSPSTMRSPEHHAWHPFGRMPAIRHDGYALYETQAILRYIDRIIVQPPLSPTQPQACGRMDQLMNINDWYLFQGVGNVIGFQRILAPKFFGRAPDETVIELAMPKARVVFDELARLLGDQPYFTGDTFTLADVMLAPQLDFMQQVPEWEPLTANAGNLRAWLDRMNARSSMQATTWERVAALAQVDRAA